METVQLTCQMAALAGSAQHASGGAPAIWRIASRLLHRLGSKRRSNFADVCVFRDFGRRRRELTAYGRMNTDKFGGCRRRLALEFEMSYLSEGRSVLAHTPEHRCTNSLSDFARKLFPKFETTPTFVLLMVNFHFFPFRIPVKRHAGDLKLKEPLNSQSVNLSGEKLRLLPPVLYNFEKLFGELKKFLYK